MLSLDAMSLDERMGFERQEFGKFSQLPLHWIPYESIVHKLGSKEQKVRENMVEIVLVDARDVNEARGHRVCPSPIGLNGLPFKFQYRNEILESINLHNAGPLW